MDTITIHIMGIILTVWMKEATQIEQAQALIEIIGLEKYSLIMREEVALELDYPLIQAILLLLNDTLN